MPNSTDYYELLHLQPDAPAALIKASYRTLMQKLKMHPDLGGDADLASQLNVAYHTLRDPNLRAQYDRGREPELSPTSAPVNNSSEVSSPKAAKTRRVMWTGTDLKSATQCLFCDTLHSYHTYPPRTALCSGCSCPLSLTDKRNPLAGERRELERLDVQRYIEYRSLPGGSMQTVRTSDLSLQGLNFSATEKLINNQLVQIHSSFCYALGRIAHVDGPPTDQQRFGVEFVTLCFPNATGSLVSTHA